MHREQSFLVVLPPVDVLEPLDDVQVLRVEFEDALQEGDRLGLVGHPRDGDLRDAVEEFEQFVRLLGDGDLLLEHAEEVRPAFPGLVPAGQGLEGLPVGRGDLGDPGVGREDVVLAREFLGVLVDLDDAEERGHALVHRVLGQPPQPLVVELDQRVPLGGLFVQGHDRGLGLFVQRDDGQDALVRLERPLEVVQAMLGHLRHLAVDADLLGGVLDHGQGELQGGEQFLVVPRRLVVLLVEPQGIHVARVHGPKAPPGPLGLLDPAEPRLQPRQDREDPGLLGGTRARDPGLFDQGKRVLGATQGLAGLDQPLQCLGGRRFHVEHGLERRAGRRGFPKQFQLKSSEVRQKRGPRRLALARGQGPRIPPLDLLLAPRGHEDPRDQPQGVRVGRRLVEHALQGLEGLLGVAVHERSDFLDATGLPSRHLRLALPALPPQGGVPLPIRFRGHGGEGLEEARRLRGVQVLREPVVQGHPAGGVQASDRGHEPRGLGPGLVAQVPRVQVRSHGRHAPGPGFPGACGEPRQQPGQVPGPARHLVGGRRLPGLLADTVHGGDQVLRRQGPRRVAEVRLSGLDTQVLQDPPDIPLLHPSPLPHGFRPLEPRNARTISVQVFFSMAE